MDKDLLAALAPNTNQLNADDLISIASLVVTIKGPVTVGDGKLNIPLEEVKPYRPSKGMGRILASMYGDRENWIGKKLRIYRDPDVRFGKNKVGGLKISEASHISSAQTHMVTVARAKKEPHVINPLKEETDPVLSVQVKFRQAVTADELDKAVASAKDCGFSEQQKARLAEDYQAALKRIKENDKA